MTRLRAGAGWSYVLAVALAFAMWTVGASPAAASGRLGPGWSAQDSGDADDADEPGQATDDGPALMPVNTQATGNGIKAGATDAKGGGVQEPEPGARSGRGSGPVLVQFIRAEACGVLSAGDGFEGLFPCADGVVRDHSDVCGQAPVVLPTWRRDRASGFVQWGEWRLVAELSCVGGPVPSPDQVLAEFRRLVVVPSVLRVQPGVGEVLVGMDTIAYTDHAPQVLSTTLLGVVVEFTVVPVGFTWDFGADGGKGAPFTTTSPGHAYPDQDVAYVYRHVGTGRVVLTTTWAATYTVGSDPAVRQVPGVATTVSTSREFEIVQLPTHLVAGSCAQDPVGAGC